MALQNQTSPELPSRLEFAVPLARLAEVAAGHPSAWSHRSNVLYASDAGVQRAVLWHTWASDRIKTFLESYQGTEYRHLRVPLYRWLVQKWETLRKAKVSANYSLWMLRIRWYVILEFQPTSFI